MSFKFKATTMLVSVIALSSFGTHCAYSSDDIHKNPAALHDLNVKETTTSDTENVHHTKSDVEPAETRVTDQSSSVSVVKDNDIVDQKSPEDAPPATRGTKERHDYKTYDAQIVAVDQANIGAPMNGRLDKFPFHDGDTFRKGDVLAHYTCLAQKAQYEKGMAELFKANGMHVLQTKMKKMGQYSTADLLSNEAEIRQGHADVDNAQSLLNDCSVIAPYNGVVSSVHVNNYQYTQAGSPLIDIVSNEAYEVSMIVDSVDMNKFHPGSFIRVHINELDRNIYAEFSRISGKIDPVSRTVRVYARIHDEQLRPGMTGTATLEQ